MISFTTYIVSCIVCLVAGVAGHAFWSRLWLKARDAAEAKIKEQADKVVK